VFSLETHKTGVGEITKLKSVLFSQYNDQERKYCSPSTDLNTLFYSNATRQRKQSVVVIMAVKRLGKIIPKRRYKLPSGQNE
jgi:hypothetical protein